MNDQIEDSNNQDVLPNISEIECDAVENVWQNKMITLAYVAGASLVSYLLVLSFVLVNS